MLLWVSPTIKTCILGYISCQCSWPRHSLRIWSKPSGPVHWVRYRLDADCHWYYIVYCMWVLYILPLSILMLHRILIWLKMSSDIMFWKWFFKKQKIYLYYLTAVKKYQHLFNWILDVQIKCQHNQKNNKRLVRVYIHVDKPNFQNSLQKKYVGYNYCISSHFIFIFFQENLWHELEKFKNVGWVEFCRGFIIILNMLCF